MTIFNGGTFGPAKPKLSPDPLSSASGSLSVDFDVDGFGLPLGLLRSNEVATLLGMAAFFSPVLAVLLLFSWRCCDVRLPFNDLFASLLLDSLPVSFRFLRFKSSSLSPSTSEYDRFIGASSLFSSLSDPLPLSDLSSPDELDDESFGVVLNSYTSSSGGLDVDLAELPDAVLVSSWSSSDFFDSEVFLIDCCERPLAASGIP